MLILSLHLLLRNERHPTHPHLPHASLPEVLLCIWQELVLTRRRDWKLIPGAGFIFSPRPLSMACHPLALPVSLGIFYLLEMRNAINDLPSPPPPQPSHPLQCPHLLIADRRAQEVSFEKGKRRQNGWKRTVRSLGSSLFLHAVH